MNDKHTLVDLRVAQLMCSRLCHDLVGPAGAVNAGVEALEDGGGAADAEATVLIADCARQMSDRLAFFRAVFGGGEVAGATADGRRLTEGMLKGGRVSLDWPDEPSLPGDLPSGAVKLLLNLILVSLDSLPRGGVIGVRLAFLDEGTGVAITARGPGACLREDIRAALQPHASSEELTARNVHGFFAMKLAESLGASIEAGGGGVGETRLAALFPRRA